MKNLSQIIIIAVSIGFLSASVEVRPLIGELIEGAVGAAEDLTLAPLEVPQGDYWWHYYWGPDYWANVRYYPYLIERYPYERRIEIAGDDWDITNKTNNEIIVGTYDGKIRGRIRPGETVRIPTQGDDRLIIGHKNAKPKIFTAEPGDVVVTEKSNQEIEITP